MKKNNRFIVLAFGSLLLCLLYFFQGINNNNVKHLKQNKSVIIGQVTTVENVIKGDGIWVNYSFVVDNNVSVNRIRIFIESQNLREVKQLLANVPIPIIYDSTNKKNNKCYF